MPRMLQVTTVRGTLRLFLLPFARHLRQQGWEVDAASSDVESQPDCVAAFDRCYDVPFSRRSLSLANVTSARTRIAQVVQDGNYDIVHVHSPIAAFVTRFALRNRPSHRKLVYTAHGFHFFDGAPRIQGALFKAAERTAGAWMDHLIVINRMDYKNALRLGLGTPETVTYMPGIGINPEEYRLPDSADEIRQSVCAELGVPPESKIFLLVAGFSRNKRHCDAIQALSILKRHPTFHLVFVGKGTSRASLQQLATEHGVQDRVHALEFRTDIPRLLAASDAVMLISQREGLPRSVMEALAMGKTVIGSAIRGTSDLLRDDAGILTPACNPKALAEAMLRAVEFTPNRVAQQKILAECSLESILQQHDSIYKNLIAGSSRLATDSHQHVAKVLSSKSDVTKAAPNG